ncbi:MAG: phosphatase PAP2 family protein [Gemmataceae bacterium]
MVSPSPIGLATVVKRTSLIMLLALATVSLTFALGPIDLTGPLALAAYWTAESGGTLGTPWIVLLMTTMIVVRPGSSWQRCGAEFAVITACLGTLFGAAAYLNEFAVKPWFAVPRPAILELAKGGKEGSVLGMEVEQFYKLSTKALRSAHLEKVLTAESQPTMDALIRGHWIHETGYSFPSGHSFSAMLVATVYLGLALSYLPNRRLWPFACLVVWAVCVCFSRPLLRVHSPEDVCVGATEGIAVGLLAVAMARVLLDRLGRRAYLAGSQQTSAASGANHAPGAAGAVLRIAVACFSKRRLRMLPAGLCLSFCLVAFGEAAAQDQSALAKKAEHILKIHCHRCHGQDGAAEGGFNYVLDVPTLIEREKVLPRDSGKSKLLSVIQKNRMPPVGEGPRPTEADVQDLRAWIDAGSPDFRPAEKARPFVTTDAMFELIAADLESLDEFDRQYARFFSLVHLRNAGLSDDRLQTYRLGLSRLVNSLSWGRKVVTPKAIDADKTILRIDLRDYRWKVEAWDRLAAANPFAVRFQFRAAKDASRLAGTAQPFVRGDWFVFAASKPPLYHDLLEIPRTDALLEKLLQVDTAKNLRERRIARAGFNGSGVSQNNRMIERHELDLTNGAYWKSYDFASNSGKQNLFNHPLGVEAGPSSFQHDGGEIIFSLPNGLQAYMLADAKGTRIDKAPNSIVSDPKRPDRAVLNGISCMSCHHQGIIEKEDQIRKHVEANRGAFGAKESDLILGLYPAAKTMSAYYQEDADRFAKAVEKTGQKLNANGRIAGSDPVVALTAFFEQELDLSLAAAVRRYLG